MNYLDLFSGIGGFHLGLLEAGFKFEQTFHSEVDKYANQIYEKHFPESVGLGDVRAIDVDNLPRIDLITFGFPCQDLSVAGKRGGLSAKRSGLFFEAMRIIEAAKPEVFIFENVKGLLSSNSGQDFITVLRTIADLGIYECEWQLLNTRWFLPQNRERIYFIGHLAGSGRPKVFPIGEGKRDVAEGREEYEGGLVCNGLDSNYYKGADGKRTMIMRVDRDTKYYQDRIYSVKGEAPTLPTGTGGNHMPFIVDSANTGGIQQGKGIRRLTPTECARLQGFPDNWCEGLSDTQAYKCFGNAVSVPVVKAIGERLIA